MITEYTQPNLDIDRLCLSDEFNYPDNLITY